MVKSKVRHETFLQFLKQDCLLIPIFLLFINYYKRKRALCKSLGTLLDYSSLLLKKMISKSPDPGDLLIRA